METQVQKLVVVVVVVVLPLLHLSSWMELELCQLPVVAPYQVPSRKSLSITSTA